MSAIELSSKMPLKRISYITGMPRSFIYYNLNRNSINRKEYKTGKGKNTVDKIIELSSERITYDYRRIWALLRNSGISINRKTVYKIMGDNNPMWNAALYCYNHGMHSLLLFFLHYFIHCFPVYIDSTVP